MEILIVREPVDRETLDALAKEWHRTLVIRPAQGNRSMEIESAGIRTAVRKTVAFAVPFLGL